jgi:predicted ATP-grasp superfamily ATP-dependent carboligase
MASFNGHLASLTQTLQVGGVSYVTVSAEVPQKWFRTGLFAIKTLDGVSGSFGVQIVGSVGGATFVIAGVTTVNSAASRIIGTTGGATFGIPRPMYVAFQSAGTVTGFTASVYLAGDYS